VGRAFGVKHSAVVGLAMLLLFSSSLFSQFRLMTREEVLASVYLGATVEAERVFLTSDQIKRASELARVDIESSLVARYVVREGGLVVGRAYVDTHVVRTKPESILVALTSDGAVRRVEITAFLEPRDYLVSQEWLRQFDAQPLNDDVALQRAIRPIAGATLTARSVTDAVRRVMAIDEVLEKDGR
jgi:electron transport complex protein RnfG